MPRRLLSVLAGSLALLLAPSAGLAAGKSRPAAAKQVRKQAPPKKFHKPVKAQAKKDEPAPEKTAEAPTPEGQPLRRGERVEFDARLIQGQTAKAGAVYLFERASSDLSSMVQERKSYRSEIVDEVLPEEKKP